MNDSIPDDSLWRHYKGTLYKIICLAQHTETNEMLVIYRNTSDANSQVWCRPASMFLDILPGTDTQRFTREE